MTVNQKDVLAFVANAQKPEDIFGNVSTDEAKILRTKLLDFVRPDFAPSSKRVEFTDAYDKLNLFFDEFLVGRGVSSLVNVKVSDEVSYKFGTLVSSCFIANSYQGTRVSPDGNKRVTLKMVRSSDFNDLMEREVVSVIKLHNTVGTSYFPSLVDSFVEKDELGGERQVNVFEPLTGFVSLEDVGKAFPDGVETKDMAWMFRRVLVALGYAHQEGILNGGVLPKFVQILPEQHGLVLNSWTSSSLLKDHRLEVIDKSNKDFYPPMDTGGNIFNHQPIDTSFDIYMAVTTFESILEPRLPPELRAYLDKYKKEINKNIDAWEALREFDEVIEKLYGPRKFKPFVMPSMTA